MARLTPEFKTVIKAAMRQGGLTLDELVDAIREEMGGDESTPAPTDEDATVKELVVAATRRLAAENAEEQITLLMRKHGLTKTLVLKLQTVHSPKEFAAVMKGEA